MHKTREEPKNAAKHEDKSLDVGEIKLMEEDYAIPSSDVKSQIPPFDVLFKPSKRMFKSKTNMHNKKEFPTSTKKVYPEFYY